MRIGLKRQTLVLSMYGLALTLLFFSFQVLAQLRAAAVDLVAGDEVKDQPVGVRILRGDAQQNIERNSSRLRYTHQ